MSKISFCRCCRSAASSSGALCGIGACITLGEQVNCKTSSVGYASSSLTPVHFGLGKASTVPDAQVLWPSGAKQTVTGLKPGQVVTVREP